MITNPPRTILAGLLTVASLAAGYAVVPSAHAEPNGGGSGSSSSGNCGSMENGEVRTYKRRYERGTITCKDGVRCHSWKVKQGDGSWRSFKECKKVNSIDSEAPTADGRAGVAANSSATIAASP